MAFKILGLPLSPLGDWLVREVTSQGCVWKREGEGGGDLCEAASSSPGATTGTGGAAGFTGERQGSCRGL